MGLAAMMMSVGGGDGAGSFAMHRARQRFELRDTLQKLLLDIFVPLREAQAAPLMAASVPDTVGVCPDLTTSDVNLVRCRSYDPGQNSIQWLDPGADPKYLVRRMPHCRFGTDGDVYFLYSVLELPDAATCTAVMASGLTAGTIANQSVTMTFGLLEGGDQQSYIIPKTKYKGTVRSRVIYVNNILASGWDVNRTGGNVISYDASGRPSQIVINGLHFVERIWDVEASTKTILDTFIDKPAPLDVSAVPWKLRWDATISTVKAGDRHWRSADVAQDETYAADQPLQLSYSVGTKRVDGGLIRIQHNEMDDGRRSNSVISIKTQLAFTDPACCLPMSGTIRSDYGPSLPPPSDGSVSFLAEETKFTGTACGAVEVKQLDEDDNVLRTYETIFEYCGQ